VRLRIFYFFLWYQFHYLPLLCIHR
jgi:hypothetical protein